MRLRLILISIVIMLILSGCTAEVQTTSKIEKSVGSESLEEKNAGSEIWDAFIKQNGDSIDALQQPPQEPDLLPLYIEGLKHQSPIVRWYSANKAIEYAFDNRGQELLSALEKLRNDPDDKVRESAEFAISAINKSFEGDKFAKTKDGKRAAFYGYHGLTYNDGYMYLYTENTTGGWYGYDFEGSISKMAWSPDGNKLCVEYEGRTWHIVSYIDVKDYSMHKVGLISYLLKDQEKFNYKSKTNQRPDPQVTLLEWSPDGSKMLLFYSFTDDDYKIQSGAAVYDIPSNDFQRIWPYPAEEDEGVVPVKPQHFMW